jgi:hypothetical protein
VCVEVKLVDQVINVASLYVVGEGLDSWHRLRVEDRLQVGVLLLLHEAFLTVLQIQLPVPGTKQLVVLDVLLEASE